MDELKSGTPLYTKDVRKVGNATVVKACKGLSDSEPIVYQLCAQFNTELYLTLAEIKRFFYLTKEGD